MKIVTNHTLTLSEAETKLAIIAYLRNRDIPVPPEPIAVGIKWTSKGEAKVSFCLEESPVPERQT